MQMDRGHHLELNGDAAMLRWELNFNPKRQSQHAVETPGSGLRKGIPSNPSCVTRVLNRVANAGIRRCCRVYRQLSTLATDATDRTTKPSDGALNNRSRPHDHLGDPASSQRLVHDKRTPSRRPALRQSHLRQDERLRNTSILHTRYFCLAVAKSCGRQLTSPRHRKSMTIMV